jgi:thymidylate kinase
MNISFPLQFPTNVQSDARKHLTVASECSADLQAVADVSDFLRALFGVLHDSAIQYCVLKRREVVSGVSMEVLELAVHRAHRRKLPRIFCNLPKERYLPVQCIGGDAGTDQFHFALSHGPQPQFLRVNVLYPQRGFLLSAVQNEIFVRRQWQGNCWMASPTDEFSYLLAKTMQAGSLTNGDGARLKLLVERLGPAAAEPAAGELFGLRNRKEIVVACSTNVLGSILHKLKYVPRRNVAFKGVRSTIATIRKVQQWFRDWFRPNGLVITILGPDGAGKTTISKKILDLFGPEFGPHKLLMWRPEVLPRLTQDPITIDLPHSKPPHGYWESLARILATFLDYWIGHFIMVKPLLCRSALILYDRDMHDILVDSRRYRYGGPTWILRLLTNALPRTESLFLVLNAAPEVILERKQEVHPEEVRRQLAAYQRLAAELPDSYLIRTDGGLEATTSSVTQSIVRHLGLRYERRYLQKKTAGALA